MATVLLIVLVVAGVSIVMFWGRDYIKDIQQKSGTKVDELSCSSVQLSVQDVGGSVKVENTGVDLSGVVMRVSGDGEPQAITYPQEIKSAASRSFPYASIPGVSNINKVSIIPMLGLGINRPCTDQRVDLEL